MAAGNPNLAQMAALYRQAGANQPNPGDEIAQGISGAPMPAFTGDLNALGAEDTHESIRQATGEQSQLFDRMNEEYKHQLALNALQAMQAQAAVPHIRQMLRPIGGQGLGHDILNAIRDVGVGALAVGSATTPGQAIEGALYAPQRAALASTLREQQQTQAAAANTMGAYGHAAAQLARPFGAQAQEGRTAMNWTEFEKKHAEQIREFDTRTQQELKLGEAKLANAKSIAEKHDLAMIMARQILAGATIDAAQLRLQGDNARTFVMGQIAKTRAVASGPVWSALTQLVGETYAPNAQPLYSPLGPSGPAAPQGSMGRRAPARPKGVPAGARWNPTTRTWQLHQ